LKLASDGVTEYTITAIGNGAAIPASSNKTASDQARNRKVVANIS
jgi:outer membrane protein OmpA-like peptidoglycan-associated protein